MKIIRVSRGVRKKSKNGCEHRENAGAGKGVDFCGCSGQKRERKKKVTIRVSYPPRLELLELLDNAISLFFRFCRRRFKILASSSDIWKPMKKLGKRVRAFANQLTRAHFPWNLTRIRRMKSSPFPLVPSVSLPPPFFLFFSPLSLPDYSSFDCHIDCIDSFFLRFLSFFIFSLFCFFLLKCFTLFLLFFFSIRIASASRASLSLSLFFQLLALFFVSLLISRFKFVRILFF